MGKKKKKIEVFVYDPQDDQDEPEFVEPAEQRLRIRMEKKQRGGKMATLISGYEGTGIDSLAKKLKSSCGVGGSVKDGEILVQGDQRRKVKELLIKWGYGNVK